MYDILFKNVTIVTVNEKMDVFHNAYLGVKDQKITYIGADCPSEGGEKIIDGKHKLIMPGLINTHTHLPMTLIRGYADDMFLQPWLTEKVFPAEAKFDDKCARIGSILGVAEMLRNGITSFTDMYDHVDQIANVVLESGIKANLGRPIVDFKPDDFNFEETTSYKELKELVSNYHMADKGRIKIDASIHAVYTSHPKAWEAMANYAKKNNLGLHVHLSETMVENNEAQAIYKKSPSKLLEEAGVFFKGSHMAHGVHLSDDDVEIMVKNQVSLSHQIVSNLKLACGIARVPYYLEKGMNVSIGTDSVCSNNNIDMFEEMKMAAIVQKTALMDPTVMPAPLLVKMATKNGAISQLRENECGSLEVGKDADIIMLDLKAPNLIPSYDPYSSIVYSTKGENVILTMVRGKILYEDGNFYTLDYNKAVEDLETYAIPRIFGNF
ncbi:MAG: amidohydrolase family protein [Filifactoraceae bacterium]